MRIIILLLLSITAFSQGFWPTVGSPSGAKTPDIYVYYIDDQPIGVGGLNQPTYVANSTAWAHPTNTDVSVGAFQNTLSWSNTLNDYVTMQFRGYQIELLLEKYPNHGYAAISIDGGTEVLIDTYAPERVPQWLAWNSRQSGSPYEDLTNGLHTVKIRVNHTKNVSATDYYVVFDVARIHTNSAATPPIPPTPTPSEHRIYVKKTGNDGTGTGAVGSPYLTGTKAASVAEPGDTIRFGPGTYRETIVPPSGIAGLPIVFMPDEGGSNRAVISGLEDAGSTGWTVHSGNIYKKTITLPVSNNFNTSTGGTNTTLLANQVFDDGVMMPQARYPKIDTPEDMLDKSKWRPRGSTTTFTNTQIVDTGLGSFASGTLNGATMFLNGWFLSETRTISSNSGNTVNFSGGTVSFVDKFYYVTNALSLLTQAKEWHYTGGVLYFWQNGGGSPTGVEYKARNWGFDLRGKSYVVIDGFVFTGCEPAYGNAFTSNVIIDHVTSTYQNHGVLTPEASPEYHYNAKQVGVYLGGNNNVVRNSTFTYGIQGIWAGGNTQINNCKFSYYGYDGTYGSPIAPLNNSSGVGITNCTIDHVGRSNIDLSSYTRGNQVPHQYLNMNIAYNDMSYHSMQVSDNGAIYSNVFNNLTGTRIHHNWIHHNAITKVGGVDGVQVTGGYFDQGSGPVTWDHNVTWNGDECDFYSEGEATGRSGHFMYNNTSAGTTDRSYITYSPANPKDVQKNNIYLGDISASGPNITNSIMKGTNPLFTGGSLTTPAVYFTLQAGSPARGAAATISGINDDDTSPKDIGAYPYGQTAWTAGYTAVTYTPIP